MNRIERNEFVDDLEVEVEFVDDVVSDINDNVIDDDPVMIEPFNPAEINIVPKQDTLRNLIDRLRHDEIDMNTDFQRHVDLWDSTKMSRLIESILIRFPLPAFYFDATNEDCWLVVDGLQRLSSIKKFVVENDSKKKLRLRGLEYLKEFIGKTYEELPRTYQRRIDECPVTLFLIQPGTPDKVKYSIFRRINTGGLVLTNQEIRNAMAKPILRKFLQNLAEDQYLKKTIGDQAKRMVDQELVLRFIAFYAMNYELSKKNITTFLDEMMEKLEKSDQKELDRLAGAFKLALQRCWEVFGDAAFEKRINDSEARKVRKNSTLFEVWSLSLVKLSDVNYKILLERKKELERRHFELMRTNDSYFRSITFSTQKRDYYRIRHEQVNGIIREVINA
jgi:hypothetical protein